MDVDTVQRDGESAAAAEGDRVIFQLTAHVQVIDERQDEESDHCQSGCQHKSGSFF